MFRSVCFPTPFKVQMRSLLLCDAFSSSKQLTTVPSSLMLGLSCLFASFIIFCLVIPLLILFCCLALCMFIPSLPELVVALCFLQCLAHCGCLFEPGKGRGQSEVRSQGDLIMLPLPSLPIRISRCSVNQHAFSSPLLGAGPALEAG